jgi:hypothetical protein
MPTRRPFARRCRRVRGGAFGQERTRMSAPGSNEPPRAPAPRDAIALAFDEIGGVAALASWVEASDDNRKIFYATIYPKILSLDFGGEPAAAAIDEVRWTIVRP